MIGFVGSVLTGVSLLAEDPPAEIDPTTGKGPEWGKAAPIGLLIVLLMGVALYFLIKSMNTNLRRVPSSFDADSGAVSDDGDQADVSSAASTDPPTDPDTTDPDTTEPLAGTAADRVERPR